MSNVLTESDPRVQEAIKGLTTRQARYAIERAADPTISGTEAVKRAGYSGGDGALGRQAFDNQRNHKIHAAIEALRSVAGTAILVTVDSVRGNLARLRDKAETKGDLPSAIRAEELLGKTIAAFAERSMTEDVNESKRLEERTETEQAEIRRLAQVRLTKTG